MKKYLHFEGLRGIAAFIVFLAHFKVSFYQKFDTDVLSALSIDDPTAKTIALDFLKIIYDGRLPVFIFWLMSSFVISIKLFDPVKNNNNNYLIEATTKRYFRLAIPVFFSSLICFILMKTGGLLNVELANSSGPDFNKTWLTSWYQFNPTVINFFRTTFVDVFASANSNFNTVLWTMSPELLGSFLCFSFFALAKNNTNRFLMYFLVLLFLFLAGIITRSYSFYFTFVFGLMWCDTVHSTDENVKYREIVKNILGSKIFPAILIVFGYGLTMLSDIYHFLHPSFYHFLDYVFKAIGITLFINNSGLLQKLFTNKLFVFLGRISFSLYLIHIPIMFSLGAYYFIHSSQDPANKIATIFILLTLVTVIISYLFEIIVDKKAIRFSNKIGKFFTRQ